MLKQSKGSKQIKSVNLSSLDGVRDVALGHKATAERSPRNYSKSDDAVEANELSEPDSDYDDVKARNKRWGL
jgi:hypothetical protein